MRMTVQILKEEGYHEAMLGLSLNKNQPILKMHKVADKLAHMDGGHNKFLESMVVWLDINAPRYWWQEFDTYRAGVTKQSQSTMHTIMKRDLRQADFNVDIPLNFLGTMNALIDEEDFSGVKALLPESFLQRRVVCTNYKTLRHIWSQRKKHRLKEWTEVFSDALELLEFVKWIKGEG